MPKKFILYFWIAVVNAILQIPASAVPSSHKLNGTWSARTGDSETIRNVTVPGIVNDPAEVDSGSVWLRRELQLPEGDWDTLSLLFKGARFNPSVYINGERVSFKEGGMGPRTHYLEHAELRPGNRVMLEVKLMSLVDMSEENASYIPVADHWRSSVSAYVWDDVVMHFHKGVAIDRMIPFTDIQSGKVDIDVLAKVLSEGVGKVSVRATLSKEGRVLAMGEAPLEENGENCVVTVPFNGKIKLWTPDTPHLYDLTVELLSGAVLLDKRDYTYGAKEFKLNASGKKFLLNGKPFTARAGTVVWPRWVRNPEGYELAWDEAWFEKNIILRLKELGANTLRFHLGNAPEKYIDLCDKHGLLVQYEWSFFHGMPASVESLLDQWPDWFELGLRHASVGLYHPYNETNPEWLDPAWTAINQITEDYPPILIADRDIIHVHKYWWSLFENLGLYYDSHDQFPKAIMVDEFGGNYLDANYDYGLYKTVKDTFRRFLGENETVAQRIKLQTQANVKIAEYWRRIGAAGFSPFCALGSHEDGSHWFEGDLKEGNPKPVWNALAVAYAPLSVSLNIWDQNFEGGQSIEVPVHFFNDTAEAVEMEALVTVEEGEARLFKQTIRNTVQAYTSKVVTCAMTLPVAPGKYWIKAMLLNKQRQVKHPVVSEWDICVLETRKSPQLEQVVLGIPDEERELATFADQQGLQHVRPGQGRDYDLLLLSRESWNRIAAQDEAFKKYIEASVTGGRPALLLDVGTQFLGQGYPENEGDLGPLQGAFRLTEQRKQTTHVFGSLSLVFGQAAEPESHMHAHPDNNALWKHLLEDDAWLWNGYRGGLIVPANVMEVRGLSQKSFFDLWVERGADPESIRCNPNYTAYELDGYYAFSEQPKVDQSTVIQGLRDHITFIQQDAPAIAAYIDPGAPVEIHALNREYNKLRGDSDSQMMIEPLAVAGKGLSKVPVVKIHLGGGAGDVIASQLLTKGRLAKGFGSEGFYDVRYDPAAVQMVLNMIEYLSTTP